MVDVSALEPLIDQSRQLLLRLLLPRVQFVLGDIDFMLYMRVHMRVFCDDSATAATVACTGRGY